MPASMRGPAAPKPGRSARDLADLLASSLRDMLVRAAGAVGYHPAVESFIQGDQFVIRADLPGLDPADVVTSVRGNRLTIKAERKRDRDGKGRRAQHLQQEISYGTFRRQLRLPDGVEQQGIAATYANGVLEIRLRVPAEVPQSVPVESEARIHPVKVRRTRKARQTAA